MAKAVSARWFVENERRRVVALCLPVVLPVCMVALFSVAGERLGQ